MSITPSSYRRLPKPIFDEALPIFQKREVIKAALSDHQVIIVCGETGSGKTTQLPQICLELGRGVCGWIGHTQPRRLAARAVASRIAHELKTELGSVVGFKVRFTDQSSPNQSIKVMTDGILLAETLSDPLLTAYDTIIIDEAHERSLNIDFLLGYIKQLLSKRPDLKLIVTSATINAELFSHYFSDTRAAAPIIEVSGRTYPVDIHYKPLNTDNQDDQELEMEEAIVATVEMLWHQEGVGDVLVFLPGEREIRETAEELHRAKIMGAEILPLFARLSHEDQQRIFRPSQGRRIILTTNVAETSLTVPGVRYVIDSGLAKINRYLARSKIEQLRVEKISQASARQRAGRCGRVRAGICVRLYAESDLQSRPLFTDPEIIRSSLTSVILRMAALKLGSVSEFPFIEAPSGRLIADGYQQLHELGAVDEHKQLTAIGRQLVHLPIDPRLGRILLAGRDEHCLKEILIMTSALAIQDPRERPFDSRDTADRLHARFQNDQSDFLSWLSLWNFFSEAEANKISNRQLLTVCRAHFLSLIRLREWRDLHDQLIEILGDRDFSQSRKKRHVLINQTPASYEQIHRALLTGLLSHIGVKNPENDEYLGARGLRYHLFPGSGLKKARPEWIVSAELTETHKIYARCVAHILPEWVEKAALHLVKRHYTDPHWEKKDAQVIAFERVTLYGLPIVVHRRIHYGRIDPQEARAIFIREALVHANFDTQAAYFAHNAQLLREVEALEHKSRRQDVLVNEDALFDFFDQRLPTDIVNGAGFEVWRKEAEKKDPHILFFSHSMLMQHGAAHVGPERYPTTFPGQRWLLSYRFEPGHPLDGITVTLPLHFLNRVDPAEFEWLVPGLLREKITLLVKSLPKAIRRLCVPVPEFVTKLLIELESIDTKDRAPLLVELAQALTRHIDQTASQAVRKDDFNLDLLPPHLKMNFDIVDDAGQILGSGRDLLALRVQFSEAARLIPDCALENSPLIEKKGIQKWDFGALPVKIEWTRQNQIWTGYPALAPDEELVAIRLFDTEKAAHLVHRQGVLRLLSFALKAQLKQLPQCFSNFNTLAIQFRALSHSDDLLEDLIHCICDRAFLAEDLLPRNKEEFDHQKERAQVRLPAVREAAWQLLGRVATEYTLLNTILGKPGPIVEALKKQRDQLIFRGFMSQTPWEQLARLPIYLQALRLRYEKYPYHPTRDAQWAADIAKYWSRWEAETKQWETQGRDLTLLRSFRWMIEEWRVSLYAQELKTPYPISGKRLDKAWEVLTRH